MARDTSWGSKPNANPHAMLYTTPPKTLSDIKYAPDTLTKEQRQRIEDIKWRKNNPQELDIEDPFY